MQASGGITPLQSKRRAAIPAASHSALHRISILLRRGTTSPASTARRQKSQQAPAPMQQSIRRHHLRARTRAFPVAAGAPIFTCRRATGACGGTRRTHRRLAATARPAHTRRHAAPRRRGARTEAGADGRRRGPGPVDILSVTTALSRLVPRRGGRWRCPGCSSP